MTVWLQLLVGGVRNGRFCVPVGSRSLLAVYISGLGSFFVLFCLSLRLSLPCLSVCLSLSLSLSLPLSLALFLVSWLLCVCVCVCVRARARACARVCCLIIFLLLFLFARSIWGVGREVCVCAGGTGGIFPSLCSHAGNGIGFGQYYWIYLFWWYECSVCLCTRERDVWFWFLT